MNTVTPAERIAAALGYRKPIDGLIGSSLEMSNAFYRASLILDALCPKGERVVLDRTGETDRLLAIEPVLNLATDGDTLAAEDGYIVYQGPGVLYEIDAGEPS